MSKNELIARLVELGELLGREIDTTGTTAELEQRVTEAEEELNESADDDSTGEGATAGDSAGAVTPAGGDTGAGKSSAGLVRVLMLKTAHMHATHETNDERVEIALAGTRVRVSPEELAALEKAGLAKED